MVVVINIDMAVTESIKSSSIRFSILAVLTLFTSLGSESALAVSAAVLCSSFYSLEDSTPKTGSWPSIVFPSVGSHGEINLADQAWVNDLNRRFTHFARQLGVDRSHAQKIKFWSNQYDAMSPDYKEGDRAYVISLSRKTYETKDETIAAHELSHIATADMMGLDFVPSNLVWVVSESFSDILMSIFTGKKYISETSRLRSLNSAEPVDSYDTELTARNISQRSYRQRSDAPQSDGHLASLLITRFLFHWQKNSPEKFPAHFKFVLKEFGNFYNQLLNSDFSYANFLYDGNIVRSLSNSSKLQATIQDAFIDGPESILKLVGSQKKLLKLVSAIEKVTQIYPPQKTDANPYGYTAILELHIVAAIMLNVVPENAVGEALKPLEGDLSLALELKNLLF